MRFARVEASGSITAVVAISDMWLARVGWLLQQDNITDPLAVVSDPQLQAQLARRQNELAADLAAGRVSADWLAREGVIVRSDGANYAPPVQQCSKCVCVALNYRAHAAEGNLVAPAEPALFFKAPSALVGHRVPVIAPSITQRLDYELELAVIIGRRVRDLTPDNWQTAIGGYSIMNDVTARDLQLAALEAAVPWDRTKSFDTFGPLGPWLVTPDEITDPQDLAMELKVDENVRQSSNTSAMIFSVRELLITISQGMTLEPGDVIATGTPEGIGPVADGEWMTGRIAGLGTLANPVSYAAVADNGRASKVAA